MWFDSLEFVRKLVPSAVMLPDFQDTINLGNKLHWIKHLLLHLEQVAQHTT
ncbi:hypothetical protein LEMLEM_LOCUS9460 [Lemmus lemmus]